MWSPSAARSAAVWGPNQHNGTVTNGSGWIQFGSKGPNSASSSSEVIGDAIFCIIMHGIPQ